MPQVEDVQPKAVISDELQDSQPKLGIAPGKDVDALVSRVRTGLGQLMELLQFSPGTTPDDKAKLSNIISEYSELIDVNLGAEPGEAVRTETPGLTQLPIEAGIAKVLQAL